MDYQGRHPVLVLVKFDVQPFWHVGTIVFFVVILHVTVDFLSCAKDLGTNFSRYLIDLMSLGNFSSDTNKQQHKPADLAQPVKGAPAT